MINGSQFSANRKNIFEIDHEIRKSIDLNSSDNHFLEFSQIQSSTPLNSTKNNNQNTDHNLESLLNAIDDSTIYHQPKSRFSIPTINKQLI